MKVGIIGGGPAGMMAAIIAAKRGHDVTVIEKNVTVGRKLNITGKGRCNVSYIGDKEYFLSNVVTNSKFMISSINAFDNNDLIAYIAKLGIKTKEERGNRIFLASDNAPELSMAMQKEMERLGINILFRKRVVEITKDESKNKVTGIRFDDGGKLDVDVIVIATGGISYPGTGSTGDGYILAKKLGHGINTLKPALVPFIFYEQEECKLLEGISLKNVEMTVKTNEKIIDKRFGELMFTDKGITGPIVLSSSSKINKEQLDKYTLDKRIKISIDLKPALSEEELYKRITRDFNKYINKEFKNSLSDLTISGLIPLIISRSEISSSKKVNSITKEEKGILVKTFKSLEFTLKNLEDISLGIVTSGGVITKEINPRTMESKIVNGLYFAGEVIDVDAYTGGFNLQIAFSTGYMAGMSI